MSSDAISVSVSRVVMLPSPEDRVGMATLRPSTSCKRVVNHTLMHHHCRRKISAYSCIKYYGDTCKIHRFYKLVLFLDHKALGKCFKNLCMIHVSLVKPLWTFTFFTFPGF